VLPHLKEGSLIDVGSGGGLPGIPIALADPGRDVVLVESSHKKGAFLRQAVVELEIKNARVLIDRAENCRPLARFENVISRAFADLAEFIRVAAHLRSDTGVLLAMKGLVPYEELSQIPADWIAHSTLPLRVPELDATRHLIVMLPQTIRK
jgi:16S rRNA (guanine527-N7)-methyltransferase